MNNANNALVQGNVHGTRERSFSYIFPSQFQPRAIPSLNSRDTGYSYHQHVGWIETTNSMDLSQHVALQNPNDKASSLFILFSHDLFRSFLDFPPIVRQIIQRHGILWLSSAACEEISASLLLWMAAKSCTS